MTWFPQSRSFRGVHRSGSSNGAALPGVFRVRPVDALSRLARAARGGDRDALDRLVEGTYDQVWRLCARLVDEQCADDLAQDTYVRAVGALPNFRGQSSARTWILSIARNTCMDELRSRSRQRRRDSSLAAAITVQSHVAADAEQEVEVTEVLVGLVPERREAFVLTQLLGLSYQEAADVCGWPTGTIRSRVARARADLINALDQGGRERSSGDSTYENVTGMNPITRHTAS